jgi:hypothetical protein
MSQEPLIAPATLPQTGHADAPGLEQPAHTLERQRLADDVFSQAAQALLALQAGNAALGLIVDNAAEQTPPEDGKGPRLPPRPRPQ